MSRLCFRASKKGTTTVDILVPFRFLGRPIMDVLMAVSRRVWRGGEQDLGSGPLAVLRRVSRPDREHLHHNLLELGLSHRGAALGLYLIASLFALSGYLSLARNSLTVAALTLILPLGSVAVIKIVVAGVRARVRPGGAGGQPPA